MNILVVDDEKEIADLLEVYLGNEGFTIFKFYTGREALACIEREHIDLAVLDVMLPDMDGFAICRKIRETAPSRSSCSPPRWRRSTRSPALPIGADDYITKPFSPLEVAARVKAQLRPRYPLQRRGGRGGYGDRLPGAGDRQEHPHLHPL